LYQKDVAKLIGVTTDTITNWEKDRVGPTLRFISKVIEFLGYDPFPNSAESVGEKIKQYRRKKDFCIKKLARMLSIDPGTLGRWERGEIEPRGKLKEQVNLFLVNLTK